MRSGVFPASLALLLAVLAAPPAGAAGEEAVLERLRETASRIVTLRASLVQEKHLEMFREVLLSEGSFAFKKPGRLRWEISRPAVYGFVLSGNRGRRWRGSSPPEPFELERDPLMRVVAGQLLAWATADFPALRREYRISLLGENPVALRLDPLQPGSGFLDHLAITFSPDGGYVARVEIRERGGDFTVIRFGDVEVNPALPDDLF